MATTRLMPVHAGSKRKIEGVIDYVENSDKTRNGELITSYECDSRTADAEFNLSKRQYAQLTGRSQGGRDIIAYHMRQSFRPGEVEPAEAGRIGYELAMRFTKGNHAFIVCTHIDKKHLHNHIIFNSTTLDCKKKFRNFIGSTFAVRRISDQICLEHGLSIVESPKPSRGSYATWLGDQRDAGPNITHGVGRAKLRQQIDEVLEQKPKDFEAFISAMQGLGYEVKRGKHLSFKGYSPAATH